MGIKYRLAVPVSKTLSKICRMAKSGGTTLPGKIACGIFPDALQEAAKDYKIIMVTGTNGKTTTTCIIGQILKESGIEYITNKSGANLISGIATTFLNSADFSREPMSRTALIEIDEATFNIACDYLEPDVLVVTNFFRDQLDRYGELYTTLGGIRRGILKLNNTRLVLNADDSLCASLGKDTGKTAIYFGIGPYAYKNAEKPAYTDAMYCIYCKSKYIYSNRIYGHLGAYKCPNCGYCRPASNITCTEILELKSTYSRVQISFDNLGRHLPGNPTKKYARNTRLAKINLPGLHNIYNSLAAIACGTLIGLPAENSVRGLGSFQCGFGRMEVIDADGKHIKMILVKNPSSFNQALKFLISEDKPVQVAFLINDRAADGTDISWLWDVDFEKLRQVAPKIGKFYVSGTRAEDMALRLKYAGIGTKNIVIFKDYREMVYAGLANTPRGSSFCMLPTYTAMFDIRRHLKEMFGLKEFWE